MIFSYVMYNLKVFVFIVMVFINILSFLVILFISPDCLVIPYKPGISICSKKIFIYSQCLFSKVNKSVLNAPVTRLFENYFSDIIILYLLDFYEFNFWQFICPIQSRNFKVTIIMKLFTSIYNFTLSHLYNLCSIFNIFMNIHNNTSDLFIKLLL